MFYLRLESNYCTNLRLEFVGFVVKLYSLFQKTNKMKKSSVLRKNEKMILLEDPHQFEAENGSIQLSGIGS